MAALVGALKMKLGLIADLHANLPALKAVFAHGKDVDAWLCAGDLVGYYPDANEVCDLLREYGVPTVRGNHDAYVIGQLLPDRSKEALYRTDWTRSMLHPGNRNWLAGLPATLKLDFEGMTLTIRHASPWDEETYIYPNADITRLEVPEDSWLVLGHTHHPMVRPAGRGHVVNPGSVCQPRDYSPGACYAVLDTCSRSVDLRRATYDIPAYQARLRAIGWPEAVVSILSRREPSR